MSDSALVFSNWKLNTNLSACMIYNSIGFSSPLMIWLDNYLPANAIASNIFTMYLEDQHKLSITNVPWASRVYIGVMLTPPADF